MFQDEWVFVCCVSFHGPIRREDWPTGIYTSHTGWDDVTTWVWHAYTCWCLWKCRKKSIHCFSFSISMCSTWSACWQFADMHVSLWEQKKGWAGGFGPVGLPDTKKSHFAFCFHRMKGHKAPQVGLNIPFGWRQLAPQKGHAVDLWTPNGLVSVSEATGEA